MGVDASYRSRGKRRIGLSCGQNATAEQYSVSTDSRCDVTAHLNGAARWDLVSKVSGVEVTPEATNREDELRALNLGLDVRTTDGSYVDLYEY